MKNEQMEISRKQTINEIIRIIRKSLNTLLQVEKSRPGHSMFHHIKLKTFLGVICYETSKEALYQPEQGKK